MAYILLSDHRFINVFETKQEIIRFLNERRQFWSPHTTIIKGEFLKLHESYAVEILEDL